MKVNEIGRHFRALTGAEIRLRAPVLGTAFLDSNQARSYFPSIEDLLMESLRNNVKEMKVRLIA